LAVDLSTPNIIDGYGKCASTSMYGCPHFSAVSGPHFSGSRFFLPRFPPKQQEGDWQLLTGDARLKNCLSSPNTQISDEPK
jgi:hypothetical protein